MDALPPTAKPVNGSPKHVTPARHSPPAPGVNLNKIKLKPQAGRKVEVTMRLQVHPSSEQVAKLSDLLETDVTVLVERVQGELALDNEEKPKRAKKGGEQASLH